jgi:hypothetical protein
MGVEFRFMAGMTMIVSPMILLVFVMMILWSSSMGMIVVVLMRMIVAMIMDVLVTMPHVPVGVLMGVSMRVFVVMQMRVFVFSFHHQSSCAAGYFSFSIDSYLKCFKCFTSVCQRFN